MVNRASEYKAGLVAGTNDTVPMSGYDMSARGNDFAVGYIVGHSYTASVIAASPIAAAMMVGELARVYNLNLHLVCNKMNFNAEECLTARSSYDSAYDDDIDGEEYLLP